MCCTPFFLKKTIFSIGASSIWSSRVVRITNAWQCIRLITSSILGRYASLRNDFLVTGGMNSQLATPLTHGIQEKHIRDAYLDFTIAIVTAFNSTKYFRTIVIFIAISYDIRTFNLSPISSLNDSAKYVVLRSRRMLFHYKGD